MRRAEPSMAERESIVTRRTFIHEHMPEMLPEIKELHALGMIDGWRNVTYAGHEPPSRAGYVEPSARAGNYFAKKGK